MIKFVVAVLTLGCLATSARAPTDIEQYRAAAFGPYLSECICETGVDEQQANKFLNNAEYSSNPCFKCFLKCLYLKSDVMDANGLPTTVGDIKFPTVSRYAVEKCYNDSASVIDFCQKVYEVSQCMKQAVTE